MAMGPYGGSGALWWQWGFIARCHGCVAVEAQRAARAALCRALCQCFLSVSSLPGRLPAVLVGHARV